MNDDTAYFEESIKKQEFIEEIINSSIEQPIKIRKISELTSFINKVSLTADNYYNYHELFYRGHSKTSYKIQPSVFRNHHKNEDIIFQELLLANPTDFIKDTSTFDKLVRMQHYGLPTRILDITTNPLVALYFACSENTDEDGELLLFNIKKDNIKYFDSDTVSILSNLSRLKIEEKNTWFSEKPHTAIDSQSNLLSTYYLLMMAKYISTIETIFEKNKEIIFIKEHKLPKPYSTSKQFEILNKVNIDIKEFEVIGEYLIIFINQAYKELIENLTDSILKTQENSHSNHNDLSNELGKVSSSLNYHIQYLQKAFSTLEFLNFKEITTSLDEKLKNIVDENIPSYIPENILNKSIFEDLSSLNNNLQSLISDYKQSKQKSLTPLLKSMLSEVANFYKKSDRTDKIIKEKHNEIIKIFNQNDVVQKLLHFIKNEKPAFRPIINPQDLNKVICVKAKKNNERIISQSGEFLLFGNKKFISKYFASEDIQTIRLVIPKKNKKNIMTELNLLNINHATMFPDIQSRANHIKEKYNE